MVSKTLRVSPLQKPHRNAEPPATWKLQKKTIVGGRSSANTIGSSDASINALIGLR